MIARVFSVAEFELYYKAESVWGQIGINSKTKYDGAIQDGVMQINCEFAICHEICC